MSIVTKEGASMGQPGNSTGQLEVRLSTSAPLSQAPAERLWRSSAPAELRAAWQRGEQSAAWKILQAQLGKRERLDLGDATAAEALSWGAPGAKPLAASPAELAAQAEAWLDAARDDRAHDDEARNDDARSVNFALWSLAWAYDAARVAKSLDGDLWWAVVNQLFALVQGARGARPGEDAPAEEALVDQLLAGELALVLSTLLPEMQPLYELRKPAIAALTEGVLALTDGEGLPPARCLPRLGMLLACWTRCRAIAESTGRRCWDSAADTQYEWLVRQALRLARPDGSFAFAEPATASRQLLAVAVDMAGDDADEAAAAARIRPKIGTSDDDDPPEPVVNSEWSGVAVLAAGWKPKAPRITVHYDGPTMGLEIAAGGQVLFSGDWPIELAMAGAPIAADDDWEELCWFTDEDSDYLEVAINLENGARLERQVFLAREDGVGFLAEVLRSKADEPVAIELASRFPFVAGAAFAGERETREGWLLAGDDRVAGVVPLGLPEWRVESRLGELDADDVELRLSQLTVARNVCSPLMFDFKPRRFEKQRTWRQLTVAENLQKVAPDVAVGYRMQSGKDQWVIYRSLDPAANRTLIGGNYSSESLIGRFLPTGEVEEYWEVESE